MVVNNTSGGWVDTGSAYACSDWTPPASDYYETQMIDQTRVCSQDQESTYNYSVGGSFTDTKTVNVTEERTVEGTQPLWVDISDDVSSWTNVGPRNYTSNWSPEANGQSSDFTQTRSYTQEQERTISEREENQLNGDIRVVNSTIEEQTINGEESRIVSVSIGSWIDTGNTFSCGAWTPAANTAYETQDVEQTRVCSQSQEKTYSYNNGESYTEIQTVSVTEERTIEGTQPLWVDISDDVSDWNNVGGRNYTSDWSPEASGQSSDFTQTRSYTQEQERTISEREENQLNGDIRVVNSTIEEQTINGEESRVVSVSIGAWTDTGSTFSCGAWTPAANTAYETQEVEQTRACSQSQERIYSYNNGESYTETQTVSVTEERTVEGTQPLWVAISDDVSDWADVGSKIDTSAWSPNIIGQTSDFTQTRSYKQKQEKTTSEREENQLTGEVRIVNSTTEEQTVTREESRNVSVSETAWQNVGDVFDCSDWSPATSTVDENESFTQSRDCLQEQEKTYTYSANSSTIGSMTINRDTEVTKERQATGTNPVWISIAPSYGPWTDVDSGYDYSAWDPQATDQTSDFTQTQTYKQDQQRTVSQREKRPKTGEIRVIGTTIATRTIDKTKERNITVDKSTSSSSNEFSSCGAWDRDPRYTFVNSGTYSFQQNRTCQKETVKITRYKHNGNVIKTNTTTSTQNVNDSRTLSCVHYSYSPGNYIFGTDSDDDDFYIRWAGQDLIRNATGSYTTTIGNFTYVRGYLHNRNDERRRYGVCRF